MERRVWEAARCRVLFVLTVIVGCGPTVAEPGDGASGNSSGGGSTGVPDDGGGTTVLSATGESASSRGSTSVGVSTGEGSSTGAEMFEDGDVVGVWLCEGDQGPFVMRIDAYTSPSQLEGEVCASWNEAEDPRQWEPCGELTAHPIGGGPHLPIFAMIDDPMLGTTWIVSASLFYDVQTDSMSGLWHEMYAQTGDLDVVCERLA